MEQHLFQLSLYLLPKSGELRLRASDLPSLKVLLQKDGTQPGLELLAGSSSSEQTMRTTNLSWQRQAVGAGSGGAKVPRVPKDPGSGYGQTSLSSFYKMPHLPYLLCPSFPLLPFVHCCSHFPLLPSLPIQGPLLIAHLIPVDTTTLGPSFPPFPSNFLLFLLPPQITCNIGISHITV